MKKKFVIFYVSLSFFMGFVQAQTITLSFQGKDAQTQNSVSLTSVYIKNLTAGCDTTIYGATPSIGLIAGISENTFEGSEIFKIMPTFPNPFHGSTNVFIKLKVKARLNLSIATLQGKKIADYCSEFSIGMHKFEISSSSSEILLLTVSDGKCSKSVKLINKANGAGSNGLRYLGLSDQNLLNNNKSQQTSGFIFHLGDNLSYIIKAEEYYEDSLTDVPMQDKQYTIQLNPMQLIDGFYIKGAGTTFLSMHPNARMKLAMNAINQSYRPSLYEIYIPVKAGSGGFNIIQVAGSMRIIFGPGTDFTNVTPTSSEPKNVIFKRGSLTETTNKFTVPSNGLYHVVIDYALAKVILVQVHWGIIGSPTNLGWSASTDLNESAFDLNTMSWNISNMPFRIGEWKLRYSNGWQANLDTVVDIGGGLTGVAINTNLGGDIDNLIAGGQNIVNSDRGIYSFNISYSLGSGYNAILTKTALLPNTNWAGVKCDAVGPGISESNSEATADTSSWHWGNQLFADNGGIPSKTGNKYKWTWNNVVLKSNQGFKVRTLDGLVPPSGGFYFDAGYSDLNLGASAPQIVNDQGNLMAAVTGVYNIILTIDAANNDIKEITITNSGVIVYPLLFVPGSYQGWNPSDSSTTFSSVLSNNKYEGYIYFSDPGTQFKFCTTPDWTNDYGDTSSTATMSGFLAHSGHNIVAAEAGYYKINVDLNSLIYNVIKTTWSVIGDATSGGWLTDSQMVYDVANDKWSITLNLTQGGIKFRANGTWDLNYGDDGANGTLNQEGANILIPDAGNYTITLYLNHPVYWYSLVKN